MRKKLFLIDAYALIFRGYYALIKNPRITSKGMDTSAILGFTNSLVELIRREQPEYLGVVFDKGGSVSRTAIFEDYKANRQAAPEPIQEGVPYIYKILEAMRIPIVQLAGYEADDLIGTLAKQAEKQDFDVFMVTPDKDYAQLVSPHIFMYRPARMGNGIEIWGEQEVRDKFEVEHPMQVIDYLAMMGDSVDNIPGLPGVGDKTARKFIKAYGSIEGLYENLEHLKGKLKEKIIANKALGLCSKRLATIIQDCPIDLKDHDFYVQNPDFEKLKPIFEELEFRRVEQRLATLFGVDLADKTAGNKEKTNRSTEQPPNLFSALESDSGTAEDELLLKGQSVDAPLSRKLLLNAALKQQRVFCSFLAPAHRKTITKPYFIFSWGNDHHYLLNIPENTFARQQVIEEFQPFFENESIEKIGFHIKDQIKLLCEVGIEMKGMLWDVLLMDYLINPEQSRNDIEMLIRKYYPIDLKQEEVINYLSQVHHHVANLFQKLYQKLVDSDLLAVYQEIEFPLMGVLARMEYEGICLDVGALKILSDKITKTVNELARKIRQAAGVNFNIASPKQLGDVLFETLNISPKPKKTKTGQYSTSEEVLNKLRLEHPIIEHVLEWRGLVKLQNTYVDALPRFIGVDKRIHTTYMQNVATTGRLSSVNPNLQNVPIRTALGRHIRAAFVPCDDAHVLMSADYSQIELRLIAAMSNADDMITAFQNGEDIHAATAAKVFEVALSSVTPSQRAKAKNINFGILYGQGAKALSEQTKMSLKEAKALIQNYDEKYPQIKSYGANQIDFARDQGYVTTLFGRKRYLDQINSQNSLLRSAAERNAVNTTIQGTAADIIKKAMIQIDEALKKQGLKTKLLLQVHDELVFEVPLTEIEVVQKMVKQVMEHVIELSVPLEIGIGLGKNWLEAH